MSFWYTLSRILGVSVVSYFFSHTLDFHSANSIYGASSSVVLLCCLLVVFCEISFCSVISISATLDICHSFCLLLKRGVCGFRSFSCTSETVASFLLPAHQVSVVFSASRTQNFYDDCSISGTMGVCGEFSVTFFGLHSILCMSTVVVPVLL